MTDTPPPSFDAGIGEYRAEADRLYARLQAQDEEALWRVKWEHPEFRGKGIDAVRAASLNAEAARMVTAQQHHFDDWTALEQFVESVAHDDGARRFEQAVEAVIDGDVSTLRSMLRQHPELVRVRSARRHHATLLHYIAANGVEGYRQRTPANAVEVARLLLDAGAEVDALADMYEHRCTTMSMLVSSAPPHVAGLQSALAATLLEHGAALEGPGTNWQSAVRTALAFGFTDTARALASRAGVINDIVSAAGLGRTDRLKALLPNADPAARHAATAVAAQHGQTDALRALIDAGEDVSRYNPDGYHSHSTPLHQAIWSNHLETVRLLVERGARLDLRDTVYGATPLGWAEYGKRTGIVEYLKELNAPV